MRTSNKILLTVFIAILLSLTSIYGAIYVKYKNNNFVTAEKMREERYDVYPLKDLQSVVLSGLDQVSIIPADEAWIDVEKFNNDKPLHVFANGVLTIKGDTVVKQRDGSTAIERNYREVILHLPFIQNIKVINCNMGLRGVTDSTKKLFAQLSLENTILRLGHDLSGSVNIYEYLNGFKFDAIKNSSVSLSNNIAIKNMDATLQSTRFEDGGAVIDSLRLTADAASSFSISGKNIPGATFIAKP